MASRPLKGTPVVGYGALDPSYTSSTDQRAQALKDEQAPNTSPEVKGTPPAAAADAHPPGSQQTGQCQCRQSQPSSLPPTDVEYPSTWEDMTARKLLQAFSVDLHSEEGKRISQLFYYSQNCIHNSLILTRIVRIQNKRLWERLYRKRRDMQSGRESPVRESQMFHGTKLRNIDDICLIGFDIGKAGRHGSLHGRGIYFAHKSVNANAYSDVASDIRELPRVLRGPPPPRPPPPAQVQPSQCAPASSALDSTGVDNNGNDSRDSTPQASSAAAKEPKDWVVVEMPDSEADPRPSPRPGQTSSSSSSGPGRVPVQSEDSGKWENRKCLLLCRVLVGSMAPGHMSFIRPPPLDPKRPGGARYDSCGAELGDSFFPLVVVFREDQAYPEYVIEYKEKANKLVAFLKGLLGVLLVGAQFAIFAKLCQNTPRV